MHHRLHNVERSIYHDSDTFTHLLRVLNNTTSILDGYLTFEIIIFTPAFKAANQDLADEKNRIYASLGGRTALKQWLLDFSEPMMADETRPAKPVASQIYRFTSFFEIEHGGSREPYRDKLQILTFSHLWVILT